jgi:predicted ester cyclase
MRPGLQLILQLFSKPFQSKESIMSTLTAESKQIIAEYLEALSGKVKTDEIVDRYVADPKLKQHIREAEAAFPGYELIVDQMVSDGDTVALRGTMHGTHLGAFAGIEATGKKVSAGLMLFYRLSEGRIVEHWMQLDSMSLVHQLTH